MVSLYTVPPGGVIGSQDINQTVLTLTGQQNTPVNVKTTDPIAYTFQGQNTDPAGKTLLLYGPDGTTVILRSQATGVVASPDGTAAAPIVTTTHAQTLSNKTFDANTNTFQVLRGTAAARPAASVAGRFYFATDTNVLSMDTGAAWLDERLGSFGTFTPTMTQPGAITLSVANGRYEQVGKRIDWTINLTANSVGTAANQIGIGGLPVNSLQNGVPGQGIYQSGSTFYEVICRWNGPATFILMTANTTNSLGSAPSIAVAVNDTLQLSGWYEVA